MEYIPQDAPLREISRPSIIQGASSPPLLSITLGQLLDQQCQVRGPYECLVCPATGTRWTYDKLRDESIRIAQGLLALGLKAGDRIAILSGNFAEYIAVFFAAGYVGCILVVLNNTYTAQEAKNALAHSGEN
jgi:acyl-CoA synthetase (AMP-forming)/AMP-acid ligase II